MRFSITETPIQVRFSDFDMLGHISNSYYIHYFELGRIDLFKKSDVIDFVSVIAEMKVEFHREVTSYNVFIESYVTRIGSKSFTVVQRLFADDVHSATATFQLVGFDLETRKSKLLPEGLEISDLSMIRK